MHTPVADDFLEAAGIETPVPDVPGVIPAVGRRFHGALELKRLFDLIAVYRIADFAGDCSAYFDPASPWYNVAYGAWGVRSRKPVGGAWGFRADGSPDFDELLEVLGVDFDFLRAQPPAERLSFHVESLTKGARGPWAVADVLATIPSALHAGAASPLYGVASPSLSAGRQDFERVAMVGKLYFREAAPKLTLAWGALCPATPPGEELLEKIVSAMGRLYGMSQT
jgi:hypothetical protein